MREELHVMKVTTTTKVNGPKTKSEGTDLESKTTIPGNVSDTQTKEKCEDTKGAIRCRKSKEQSDVVNQRSNQMP